MTIPSFILIHEAIKPALFSSSATLILFMGNSLFVGFKSNSRNGSKFRIGKMALNPSSALLLCIQPQTTHLASPINSVNFALFTSNYGKKKKLNLQG